MPALETMSLGNGEDVAALQATLTTPSTAKYRFLGIIPLQAHPAQYIPMAILDVYANYFTILAFKYTTITSVTLFDALAIPSAMILSYCFLHRHYSPVHLVRWKQRKKKILPLNLCDFFAYAYIFYSSP